MGGYKLNNDYNNKNTGHDGDDDNVVLNYVSALDSETAEKARKEKQKRSLGNFYDLIETIAFAACFVILFFGFIARPAKVVGASMYPTLEENDTVIVTNLYSDLKYGDIIVFQNLETRRSDPIIKRVIATEGQWVNIVFNPDKTLTLYVADSEEELVNAKPIDESNYAIYLTDAVVLSNHEFPLQVSEGHLFVMGDNRNHSLDSRSSDIGFVPERNVVGKFVLRFMPLNKFGNVAMP